MKYTMLLFILTTNAFVGICQERFTRKEEATNSYVDSLPEGKWIEYLDSSSAPIAKEKAVYYGLMVYHKGKKDGMVRYYSVAGDRLQTETPFLNGLRNGVSRTYYSDTILLKGLFPYQTTRWKEWFTITIEMAASNPNCFSNGERSKELKKIITKTVCCKAKFRLSMTKKKDGL
ncbi:hypothetical protein [Flavisolibacter ginsenosidimutans]|uniref:hypothetical protein n=1 Tax=Flavisolibacter ginsenosidimutans TaxID=661481 RepID=UPI00155AF874|nr:hypothetical protein [Flavisolibacter ginsenosidimutans]